MTRRTLSVLGALLLVLAFSRPAAGYHHMWFYWTNSVFADHKIAVCYEYGTPVYTNRGVLQTGMNIWSQHMPDLQLASLGACSSGDVWELQVLWSNLGSCSSVWGRAYFVTWSQRVVELNENCGSGFSWTTPATGPVPDGMISAYSVAAHEFGHAAGLQHDDGSNQDPDGISNGTSDLMDDPAAPLGRQCHMSRDDALGMQARYPGLPHGDPNVYPVNKNCFN